MSDSVQIAVRESESTGWRFVTVPDVEDIERYMQQGKSGDFYESDIVDAREADEVRRGIQNEETAGRFYEFLGDGEHSGYLAVARIDVDGDFQSITAEDLNEYADI
jgi:hypothetical protein